MKYILHTLHPALEDGTDRGFRNVGKPQSDAGEIPKRIHTRFKTRRKYEIKKKGSIFNCNWYIYIPYFKVYKNCALLGYYAASTSNSLPTFRDNLSVPSLWFKNPNVLMKN